MESVLCRRTRVNAAYALWKIEGSTEDAVATLAAVLRDDSDDNISPQVRLLAARLLSKIGPPARRAAQPALRSAALSNKLRVRQAAHEALRSIAGDE